MYLIIHINKKSYGQIKNVASKNNLKKFNKKIFKRSVLGAIARLISVGLGTGASNLLFQLSGDKLKNWSIAIIMAIISFVLIILIEYEREY